MAWITGGAEAKRAFAAMMDVGKNDIAKIEAARREVMGFSDGARLCPQDQSQRGAEGEALE